MESEEAKALNAEVIKLKQQLDERQLELQQSRLREREQRVLVEALRQTITTMSSTVDLDKVLDHILDTIEHVTPYDGANVLFVESDLVHVVRQRGYTEKRLGRGLAKAAHTHYKADSLATDDGYGKT
ncbi:MAG: hypothetical protein HC915_02985, partial [Anaerolineae bacterium]|nr:hypothetical protein [Anaerolineae bacterium]